MAKVQEINVCVPRGVALGNSIWGVTERFFCVYSVSKGSTNVQFPYLLKLLIHYYSAKKG